MRSQELEEQLPRPEGSSRLDRLIRSVSLAALVFLAFLVGAMLTAANVFPGPEIARAFQGGKALYERLTARDERYSNFLWYPERRPDKGVTVHDPEKAQEGVTLYTSGHDAAAFLVAMDGTILHEWRRPFSTVLSESADAFTMWRAAAYGTNRPLPDSHVFFRKATVYPNGDLLAVYESAGDTPYGYGMVKLDRNSEIVWSYFGRTHHDFAIAPDGRIYALTHEIIDAPMSEFGNLDRMRLEDFLVILSPDGEELRRIPLMNAIAKSRYANLFHTVSSYSTGDPLHTNTVDFIDEKTAAGFDFGEPGQVLLSFRELHMIAVLDLEKEEIVWASRAYWLAQHDPDILPSGNILLFDNLGHFTAPEGPSRVIEFDPRTMEIVWQYAGTEDSPLDSDIRSSQQRLANGNTLITESSGGRILEVTPAGEIVWEYLNPVRGGDDGNMIAVICWAQRLDPAALDPALLTPQQSPERPMEETST